MLQTACVHDERPKHLSIAASMQFLANSWLPAARASKPSIEPRAIKRRPTKHDLLTRPRAQACARWIAHRSSSLVTLRKAVPFRPGTFVSPVVSIIAAGCNNPQSPNLPVAMTEEFQWDDTARADLRESLRHHILGQLRLGKLDHDDIVQFCREVSIHDQCPGAERQAFISFAREELARAAARHLLEQAAWPAETDCERLDLVELKLRAQGILLWQASPCCDSCTCGELSDRIDEIERRHPGFRKRVRGYAFFIDQNMPEMLVDDIHISLYLAYGWISGDGSRVDPESYKDNALGIAREVCGVLLECGFEPIWDGSFSTKIRVSLTWQRRTMLT